MLRALAYLHYNKIVHRDIKTTNLLVDPESQTLKLCDFGSAKLILTHKETSVAYICTRYYRAPELLLGYDHYGVEIDLWSAGCVIAELLRGGKVLFDGKNNTDQLIKIIKVLGTPTEEEVYKMNPKFSYQDLIKLKSD